MVKEAQKINVPSHEVLAEYMAESAARHHHLCPRQILGIRMGLYGLRKLRLVDENYGPRYQNGRKKLLTIVETDGCGADGVTVATDCYVGRRTLRVLDFGKMAATLVNTITEEAVRVVPSIRSRKLALELVPNARSRWHAYLEAYQIITDEKLMRLQPVILNQPLAEILSKPSALAICQWCGEEIMNEREVMLDGKIACRSCSGEVYFEEI